MDKLYIKIEGTEHLIATVVTNIYAVLNKEIEQPITQEIITEKENDRKDSSCNQVRREMQDTY